MEYVCLALLALLGAVMVAKPRLLWKIEHVFTVKDGEPTDLYLALTRIGGVLFLLCSIGFLLYLIVVR